MCTVSDGGRKRKHKDRKREKPRGREILRQTESFITPVRMFVRLPFFTSSTPSVYGTKREKTVERQLNFYVSSINALLHYRKI